MGLEPDTFTRGKLCSVRALWSLALVAGLLLGGGMWWQLDRPGRPYRTLALEYWSGDRAGSINPIRCVPLQLSTNAAGRVVQWLPMEDVIAMPWQNGVSVGFVPDIYEMTANGERRLIDGCEVLGTRLVGAGGIAVFEGGPGYVASGRLMELGRVSGSGWVPSDSGTNRWVLEVDCRPGPRVTLRCVVVGDVKGWPFKWDQLGVMCHRAGPQTVQRADWENLAFPQGRLAVGLESANRTRGELLETQWGKRSGTRRPHAMAVLAGLVFAVGLGLLPWGTSSLRTSEGWSWVGLRAGMGGALVFLAVGMGHLMLTPPLHGADEPAHVGSYFRLVGREGSLAWLERFGKEIDFARIWSRPDQKFTADDVGASGKWFNAMMDTRPRARSAVAARIWEAVSKGQGRWLILWELRWWSLYVATLGVGLGMGLVGSGGKFPGSLLPWVLVPSVPWFGMIVSNYPVTLAALALILAGMIRLVRDATWDGWSGSALGIGVGVAMHNSAGNTTLVLAVWTFLALATRVKSRNGREGRIPLNRPREAQFWAGLLVTLIATRWLSYPEYDSNSGNWVGSVLARLGIPGLDRMPLAWVWIAAFGGLMLVDVAMRVVAPPRPPDGGRLGTVQAAGYALRWPRWAAGMVVLWMVVTALTPAVRLPPLKEATDVWDPLPGMGLPLPWLEDVAKEVPRLGPVDYVVRAISAVATSFGPGDRDYLTSTLFWSYVGDRDAVLPGWVTSGLCLFFAVGLVFWLLHLGRGELPERGGMTLAWAVAMGICLVGPAVAARLSLSQPSLHGRYLIGFYLVLLTLGGMGWETFWETGGTTRRRWMAVGWVGLVITVQTVTHGVILDRYF